MKYYKRFMHKLNPLLRIYSFKPRLTALAIEINSTCNRKCAWCPNSIADRPKDKYLDETLFYSIIDQMVEMKFRGHITFNLYNEPLLDPRLPTFIDYTRKKLPASFLYLNTNGDMLTLDLWKTLRGNGLDLANVSQYDGKYNNNINSITDALDKDEIKHFYAHIFNTSTINNRAGLISTATMLPQRKLCDRPFYQLAVTYEGKVVLCCNDYFGQVEIGDIQTTKIKDLWECETFQRYRKELRKGNRKNLVLCNKCDR